MAELRIDSRMKVKTLKANFKKAFGATLRVYTTATCKSTADDEATLGSLMGEAKGGEATFGSETSKRKSQRCTASVYRLPIQQTPN